MSRSATRNDSRPTRRLVRNHGQKLAPLLACEPACILRSINDHIKRDQAEDDGRQTLDQEQPPPPGKAEDAVHLEKGDGDRPTNDCRCRDRDEKPGQRASAILGREPKREIVNYAGEEARLGRSFDEADGAEGGGPGYESLGGGPEPPADHDACQPAARAVTIHCERAGNGNENVAKVEDTCRAAELRRGQPQVPVHTQSRKGDVGSVHVVDEGRKGQEWQEAPSVLSERALRHSAEG